MIRFILLCILAVAVVSTAGCVTIESKDLGMSRFIIRVEGPFTKPSSYQKTIPYDHEGEIQELNEEWYEKALSLCPQGYWIISKEHRPALATSDFYLMPAKIVGVIECQ